MSREARVARLAVLAALLFLFVRAVILLAGGLPSRDWDYALATAPFLLAMLAFGWVLFRQRGAWRRPARLVEAGPGRRRVPATPAFGWFVAGQVLGGAGFLTSVGFALFWDPEAPPAMRYLVPAVMVLLVGTYLLLVARFVLAFRRGHPRVDLTPAGVEIREPLGRRTVPWEAMAPGTPLRQQSANTLQIRVIRPELVERRGLVLSPPRAPKVALGWLAVHPWFLADVLRFYVDQPAERAALGTPAGDERLRRALGVG
ncbi:PH domain-containing protein [Micromonospora sp. NPDC005806]|uniref:PH domain-containing protein n=1 Tax=Micromonospora sp. NPDC005806 TaxID=3364234 RepID=UPI0036BC3CF2